jgi:tetratricopeptide (TPR) repeat protein
MAGKDGDAGAVDGPKCANDGCTKKGLHMCARCKSVKYCSAACQKVHWKQGGHKQECTPSAAKASCPSSAVLATSKPSKAAVAGAGTVHGSEAEVCIICLQSDPPPIQSGCACRGDAGLAHVECRAMAAAHRTANSNTYNGWRECSTCKQDFTGAMQVGLAEAWWSTTQRLREEDDEWLAAAENLATAHSAEGQHSKAEVLYRKVLRIERRVLGPEHQNTLSTAGQVMAQLGNQRKFAEAENIGREVLAVGRRVMGLEHPATLSTAMNLASALDEQGKHAEAERMYREVLEIQRRVLGPEHQYTLGTAGNLATSLRAQGKCTEAETLNRDILEVKRRVLGPEHPDTLIVACNLANTLSAQCKYAEAEALYHDVLAARERVLGPEHPRTVLKPRKLAACIRAAGGKSNSSN